MELDVSRFRRSIRLEASYRVLQDQRLRQAREMRHMSAPAPGSGMVLFLV